MSHARLLSIAVLALLCCGCQARRRPLVVDSEPSGALVRINGADSGFATPCVLDLAHQNVETVEIELAGYRTDRYELREGVWRRSILWAEMSAGARSWNFPLFLSLEHFLLPVETSSGEMPPRLYSRLVRDRSE